MRRVAGRDDELLFGSGLRGGAALLPAGDGSGDDRPLVPVDGVRHEDRAILILGERAALDHGVELVAPPAARETGGRIRTGGLEHGKSGGADGARRGVPERAGNDRAKRRCVRHTRALPRSAIRGVRDEMDDEGGRAGLTSDDSS